MFYFRQTSIWQKMCGAKVYKLISSLIGDNTSPSCEASFWRVPSSDNTCTFSRPLCDMPASNRQTFSKSKTCCRISRLGWSHRHISSLVFCFLCLFRWHCKDQYWVDPVLTWAFQHLYVLKNDHYRGKEYIHKKLAKHRYMFLWELRAYRMLNRRPTLWRTLTFRIAQLLGKHQNRHKRFLSSAVASPGADSIAQFQFCCSGLVLHRDDNSCHLLTSRRHKRNGLRYSRHSDDSLYRSWWVSK